MKNSSKEKPVSHMREVLKGASSALMIRVFGTMLGFTVSVLIARNLGAEGSGIYFLALSVVTIAATVARLGFDNTLVRFIASHASVGEWGEIHFIHAFVIKIVVVVSFLIGLGLFFSASFIAEYVFHKAFMTLPLQLVSFAVLPLAIAMVQAESLRGLKAIPTSQWITTVFVSLFTLILLYPMVDMWGNAGAVASYVGAVFISSMLAVFLWRNAWNKKADAGVSAIAVSSSTLFSSSMPLFAVAITGLVMQQAATIFLGVWGTAEDIGVFNIANRISVLLLFPLMAMVSILTPKFSEMYRKNEMKELKELARKSSRMLIMFSIPVAVLVAVYSEWILSFFGAEFAKDTTVLLILLVGVIVNAGTGAVGNILMMSGSEKSVRNVTIVSALVTLMLLLLFVPSWGGVGAALAVTIGVSMQNILLVWSVYKKLGFISCTVGKA